MENASKAIIMAGGMLIAVAIVSLLVFAWKMFSSYQENKDSIANIEDTAKFNEQFAQYERDDVYGYEIISLINKIVDYNERVTTDSIQASNEKYTPVGIVIDLISEDERKKFTFDDNLRLFEINQYTSGELVTNNDSSRPDTFKTKVESKVKGALDTCGLGGNEERASKLAKSIDGIFMKEDQVINRAKSYYLEYGVDKNNPPQDKLDSAKEQVYDEISKKYNSIVGDTTNHVNANFVKNNFIRNGKSIRDGGKYYNAICIYYEYMQFKKGIFKCVNIIDENQSGISYDAIHGTGRITSLQFKFTGKIH